MFGQRGWIGPIGLFLGLAAVSAPALANSQSPVMIVFSVDGSNSPKQATWNGSAWSSASALPSVGGEAYWVVLRNCPTRNETACGTFDGGSDVNVLFHNGSSWSSVTELTTNADETDDRNFDIAYEQNSGDALIVGYDLGADNFRYRTYNGSTLSSSMNLTRSNLDGNDYVALYPKPNSDQIVLATLGQVDGYAEVISANVWSGSSWGGWTTIESSATTNDNECFGFAFESLSGDGLLVYGEAGHSEPRYRTWNGASWSSEGQLPSTGGAPWWVRLANDPAGDQILFAGLDSNSDINVNVWNGSSWGSNLEVETNAPAYNLRPFDIAYEPDGGHALLVYAESGQNRLRYRTWNGSAWSSETASTDLGNQGRTVELRTGLSAGEIFIAAFDDGSDLELMRWNGSSMSAKTQIEGSAGGLSSTEAFMISIPAGPATLFTDVSAPAGFGVQSSNSPDYGSGLLWADLDNDGDLDAIVTGNSSSRLLLNNGAGGFAVSTFGGGNISRQGALLDIDNDGDLDFWGIVAPSDEKLLLNNGAAAFTDAGASGFADPSENEGLAAADVNGDGWTDVVMLSGNNNWIGRNQHATPVSLAGTNAAAYGLNDSGDYGNGDYCSSGDVNNDGYLDFFYHVGTGKLFLSNADGTYTENNSGISVVTGLSSQMGSAWADYDNDGDLDLFVARYDSGSPGYLWKNRLVETGTVSFTNVAAAAGLTDTSGQRGCCWGDYDNDGDLDLYIVTRSGSANVLYQNQGSPNWNFVAVNVGAAAPGDGQDAVFVDYDNDGDLDLAVTQTSAANTLLRNNTNNSNYLKVRVLGGGACGTSRDAVGTRVELWDAAGTTRFARRDIGVARGFGGTEPLWAHFGGVNPNSTYTVKVRFVGGWTATQVVPAAASTTIGSTVIQQMLTVSEQQTAVVFTDVSVATGFNVQTTTTDGSGLHWGDLNGDGWLDAIITGDGSSRLLLSNAGQTFTVSTFGGGAVYRQGALLDIDNDGDLDFWGLPGLDDERLFLNNGTASFTNAGASGFSNPSGNEGLAAADVNGDGLADVVMFSTNANWIGHNQGTNPASLVGTSAASYGLNGAGSYGNGDFCSVGDVNNDGYPDFFYHYGGGKLFVSDGDGTYTQNNYGISIVTSDAEKVGSAWGDYDNDGDLDLFVCRYAAGQTGYLWRNDVNWTTRTGTFTNVTAAAGLSDTTGQRGCCWGDYDNDGDLDLYIVTRSGAANVLYRNQGNGTFVAACAGADAPGNGHDAVFVDYDNDGDLDLAVTQAGAANTLLRNNTNNQSYLKVRVVGRGGGGTNRAGLGVRVELWDAAGTTRLARRDIGVARGYGGAEPTWAHFGGITRASTYTVKTYFISKPMTEPYSVTVVPASASTVIGGTTIPQMLTVEEPQASRVIYWREVPRTPASGN